MKLRRNRPLILLITVITLMIVGFVLYREGTLPVNKVSPETKMFIVKPGDGLNEIARNLKKDELIRNRVVFFAVVKQLGIEKKIQAGDFRLNQSMDVYQIAQNLTHGTLDVWVTVIEGLRKEEIAAVISDAMGIPEVEIIDKGDEGYLFPDTYLFPKDATADAVIAIMRNNFDVKFTDKMKKQSAKVGLSPEQVLTMASLVEREARLDNDRQGVASVMLRRIDEGMHLNIDATVQYALGYDSIEKTWWKKNLTFDDLEINSLYNTYQNYGLPPGPICNPSLSSINAVLNADVNTPYLYYVSDSDGKIRFARNAAEHQRNIDRYLK